MTFWSEVICGKRWNCWKTIPTCVRNRACALTGILSPIELETGVADAHASSIGLFEKIDAAQERRLAAAEGPMINCALPALDSQ